MYINNNNTTGQYTRAIPELIMSILLYNVGIFFLIQQATVNFPFNQLYNVPRVYMLLIWQTSYCPKKENLRVKVGSINNQAKAPSCTRVTPGKLGHRVTLTQECSRGCGRRATNPRTRQLEFDEPSSP